MQEECAGPLEQLAKKINDRPRNHEIMTDAVLSMFILADVNVNIPEAHTAPDAAAPVSAPVPILILMTMVSAQLLIYWASLTPSAAWATGPSPRTT